MKPVLITSFTLAAIAAAWFVLQHRELESLRVRASTLEGELASARTAADPAGSPEVPRGDATGSAAPGRRDADDSGAAAAAILDGLAAMAAAGEDPDRKTAVDLLDQLGAASPGTLFALLDQITARELPDEMRLWVTAMVLAQLVEHDPVFAIERAIEDAELHDAFGQIFGAWAQRDPVAAHQWRLAAREDGRLPDTSGRLVAATRDAVAGALANHDPSIVLGHADTIDGQAQHDFLRAAAGNLATPEAWLAYAQTAADCENPQLRQTALGTLANATLHNGALDDIRQVVGRLDLPPDELNAFVQTAATRSVDSSTPERADWLVAESHPDHLHQNVEALVGIWTANDFNAAAIWLRQLEPSPLRDTAVAKFATTVARREPESAIEWAETIDNPDIRSTTLAEIERTPRPTE